MMYTLTTPVTELNGVGKTRAEQLSRLGIYTVRDLIYHFPRAYENRGRVIPLSHSSDELPASYILTVSSAPSSVRLKKNMTMTKLRAFDDSGSCEVIFFNSPFVKDVFTVGSTFRFFGKITRAKNGKLSLTNPKYDLFTENCILEDYVPVYPLTVGLTSKFLDKIIKTVIDEVLPTLEDPLPEGLREELSLCSLGYAIRNVHYPKDQGSIKISSTRLAFDELFEFALKVSLSKSARRFTEGVSFSPCSLKPLTDVLPYELTPSQKSAVNDLYRDTVLTKVNGKTPTLSRIIVGDVGCGKTIVAFAAIYIAYRSGYQCAMMVPTEILAIQHYEDMCKILGQLGLRIELLTGSVTQSRKKAIYKDLSEGKIDVVVGTHALLSDKVGFSNLGLIITDEQHRFGVDQRGVIKQREQKAHVLVMSATPIPRSLALALYGDLDISRITDMPKGRQRVDTYVVGEEYRARLNAFIRGQVKAGGQCYVVCPAIEAEDEGHVYLDNGEGILKSNENELKLKNAVEYADELKKALPDLKIEFLHGKMKNSEKDEVMHRFASGEIEVLVSTTVIEVGVNVPNACLMIVENAERFGLSQLHQLRGRVGRGTRKSYCILVSDLNSQRSKERLEIMRTTYDGYEIAEKDMMMRGPGDFFSSESGFGLRQSGGLQFRFASMCTDTNLLDRAFGAAREIIAEDPDLSMSKHKSIKEMLSSAPIKQSDIS